MSRSCETPSNVKRPSRLPSGAESLERGSAEGPVRRATAQQRTTPAAVSSSLQAGKRPGRSLHSMLAGLDRSRNTTMKVLLVLLAAALLLPLQAQQRKVVVIGQSSEIVSELRADSPSNVTIAHVTARGPGDANLLREVADAHAIIGNPTRTAVQAAKNLEWVQITSAGVKPYLYPELVESDVVMTNAQTLSSAAIADHGFAMLLALTRKLNFFITDRTSETWRRGSYDLEELEGKTALVIGTGGIGSNVARRAKAFGMTVIGVDPEEFPPRQSFDRMIYPDRLDQVIPEADAVFVCAPHTKDSEGMLGPAQFELMKRGSYFIALSRGKLYDMAALVRALDRQHLAGAGVDVTDPEPLPKGHPLWKFDNAIITPHVATQGLLGGQLRIKLYKENIARFGAREQLRNVVDMRKEY